MSLQPNERRAGLLTVKVDSEGDLRRIRLAGELDLANAATFERELDDALDDGRCQVVVDMRALTFIDSTGLALLVAAVGRDGADKRLRFVPSSATAVTRVLEVTGLDERLPLAEASADGSLGTMAG